MSDSLDLETRRRRSSGWIGGIVLILVGIIILTKNLTGFQLQNWWALFILIPAVSSLMNAWNTYRENGNQFSRGVTGPLIGGLLLSFLVVMFVLGLDFGKFWPIFLILAGLAALASAFQKE
ncbi:MAG TPA: hypothetical protein PKH92_03270 [Anaerolineaceae bacterium]|nr:hypothetical protein [Anaerolineaceae bacterium]HNS37181.1 hypothetical protein [Anaerolineaceae bacterium]HNZ13491.1 hypothetical protein [Anaerolineaceae bacterium]HOD04044.1 hypothetical protein [Anaerolineaceae bacterium]HOG79408.1 hypothetical protein [Anaerolineaceae bacterium]